MKPTYLIFDFGGVLFHWNPVRLLAQVLPERANTPESATLWKDRFFQGYTGDWGAFDAGLIDAAETVRRISSRTGLAPAEVQAVLDAVPGALSPTPGPLPLLWGFAGAGPGFLSLPNMRGPLGPTLVRPQDSLGASADRFVHPE